MKTIYRRGSRPALRPDDAGHLRRAFQLFISAAVLGGVRGRPRSRATRGTDFISASYFDLLRNYRRYGWIVLYLFGVSPVVCKSFLKGRNFELAELTSNTAYEPYATSLRMSDVGYRNRNQAGLDVSVNSLEEYVRDLHARHHDRASAVRGAGREGCRRRVSAGQRQHPADRERVLQLHPAEARGALGRAADQGAAAGGCRVRRGARAGCQCVRSGGRQSEQAAIPRGVPRAVPHEGKPADQRMRSRRARSESRDGGASRPRAGPDVVARRTHGVHAGLGAASCSTR